MNFTPEETKKLKAMFQFIVKKKQIQSDGHSGFDLRDLEPILEDMEKDGTILKRRTINTEKYFLNLK